MFSDGGINLISYARLSLPREEPPVQHLRQKLPMAWYSVLIVVGNLTSKAARDTFRFVRRQKPDLWCWSQGLELAEEDSERNKSIVFVYSNKIVQYEHFLYPYMFNLLVLLQTYYILNIVLNVLLVIRGKIYIMERRTKRFSSFLQNKRTFYEQKQILNN